MCIFFNFS
jgi:hypothetical protein